MTWPTLGWAAICGIPWRGADSAIPSTRKITPRPFIKKLSISWRPLSSNACLGPPTTSASTSSPIAVVDGLTVVESNSWSMTCLRKVYPCVRSCSPWPVVKATFRFFCVIRLMIEEISYSSPSTWPISGMASSFPWYWKQRPSQ